MSNNLKKNWSNYLQIYVLALIFFGIFFLYSKHDVGNDSSLSDWLINYEGGFVRRGLIGEIIINFSTVLSLKLRDSILIFQLFFFISYYFLIILFCKNLFHNRIIVLAIFSPIFGRLLFCLNFSKSRFILFSFINPRHLYSFQNFFIWFFYIFHAFRLPMESKGQTPLSKQFIC